MIFIVAPLFFIFLFTLQTTLIPFTEIGGFHPDLVLIAVVFIGSHFPRERSVICGAVFGLIQDALSGGFLGVNMLSKGLAALLASHLKQSIAIKNLLAQSLLVAAATILDSLVYHLLSNIFPMVQIPVDFWKDTAFLAFYNCLTAPLVFFALQNVFPSVKRTNRSW